MYLEMKKKTAVSRYNCLRGEEKTCVPLTSGDWLFCEKS